jgi:hypothetical protein
MYHFNNILAFYGDNLFDQILASSPQVENHHLSELFIV